MKFYGRESQRRSLHNMIDRRGHQISLIYGRVDLTIDLKQMNYDESAMFYPSFSNEDKVSLYSVFGGIPYYNKLIDVLKYLIKWKSYNIINQLEIP